MLPHVERVVVLIGEQELLRVLVRVDIDFRQSSVHRRVSRALVHARLEPRHDHLQFAAAVHLIHQRLGRNHVAARQDEVFDEVFICLKVDQRPADDWDSGHVDLERVLLAFRDRFWI